MTRMGELRAIVIPKARKQSRWYTRDEVLRHARGIKMDGRRCQKCKCKLRLTNPGSVCWPCGNPGQGKHSADPDDIVRSNLSRRSVMERKRITAMLTLRRAS